MSFAEGDNATSFAVMIGGLIQANLARSPQRLPDFYELRGRIGIEVDDIDEALTLDFRGDQVIIYNGLRPRRTVTLYADSETVLKLSHLGRGPLGLPVSLDSNLKDVAVKLLQGRLKVSGLPRGADTLIRLSRILSVD